MANPNSKMTVFGEWLVKPDDGSLVSSQHVTRLEPLLMELLVFLCSHAGQVVSKHELGLRAAFQNLLASVAKYVGWSLSPEMTLGKIRPDGVVLDEFRLRRGYWEAKAPNANLEKEIAKKIEHQYPLTNTIFEDSKMAILYQNKKRFPVTFNLHTSHDVSDLLQQFLQS